MEASRGADKVTIFGADEAECSETMVEIKIKTLDSETYTLRVNKCMPVPALKEQIETVTGVLSEQQRLICRGKVLKDDQLLSAYHVEDGHTLHLVVREPFNSPPTTTGMMGSESTQDHPADSSSNGTHNRGNRIAHSVVLGTVNVADQGDGIMPDLNRIVSAVLSSIGISNIGVGSEGVDHREHGMERVYRALNTSGSPDSILPPHEQARGRAHTDALHGAFRIPTSVSLGPTPPTVIPDSLATLSQYLINLRREFDASGRSRSSDVGDASLHGIGGQDHHSSSHLGIENGLPTPASLAEVMQLTRETLIEQAGGCLSQLATQLVDHGSVTDHSARISIQSNAIRSGVLLQNLGALLLELGRTTMTLRMGHTPVEAVVNAGPAVFISSSGPNPIMVQPLPFQPGTSFGAMPMGNVHSGHGLGGGTLGSSFLPRNIDIRIHTGPSISVTGNGEERAGAPQSPGQPDLASSAGANMAGQPVSGVSSSPLFTGESGVRVVPVRSVVAAVPAALSRSSPETAGSTPGLFYPLLARIQHLSSGNINERRGSQAPGENHPIAADEAAQQRVPSPAAHQQNLGLNAETSRREGNCQSVNLSPANASSVVFGTSLPTDTSTQHQQGTLPSSNFDQGNPPNNNINRNDTQAGGGPQYAQESTRQMPSRFDQLLRTIFSGEQIHVNEINFQARARGPVMEQWEESRRDDEANGASTVDMDPGIFFSSLVQQIMPFISQTTPNEATNASSAREDTSNNLETERESLSEGGSSHRCSDPPSPRSSKRQKRE